MAPLLNRSAHRGLSGRRRRKLINTFVTTAAFFLVGCCFLVLRQPVTLTPTLTLTLPTIISNAANAFPSATTLSNGITDEDSKLQLTIAVDNLQASPAHLQPNSTGPEATTSTSRKDDPSLPELPAIPSSATSWPPYSIVLKIAGSKKRVVIVLVNCGFLDVADNLIGSMLKLNMRSFVLIPLDQTSSHVLAQVYPNNTIPPNPDIDFADEEAQSIGSDAFRHLNTARPLMVRRFLEAGFSVLYTDVDMYWRSNVLQLLQEKLVHTESEAVLQSDSGGAAGICSCLIYVRPTDNTIAIMKLWEQRLHRGTFLDQGEWNFVLQVKKRIGRMKYTVLNRTHGFPSGIEYFEMMNDTERDQVHLIHNNWIIGHENKKKRFQSHNLWQPTGRLDQVKYHCKSITEQ